MLPTRPNAPDGLGDRRNSARRTEPIDGQRTPQRFGLDVPGVSLPKGGGAIRGIGETFAANPVTGTASFSVPVPTSPGRAGFGPALALRYDSGAGNGPFGLGWSLDLPSITRRTDRGIPRYDRAHESDVFLLSGADDLVPACEPDGSLIEDTVSVPGTAIRRYRPSVETMFTRVERWTVMATGDVHWRTISGDNVTTIYGATAASRITDPSDDPLRPTRIFSWLACERFDDRGNVMEYRYSAEDSKRVVATAPQEANRTPEQRAANRYLKRVLYGNTCSRLDAARFPTNTWLFELVLDYGEHDALAPTPSDAGDWNLRNDPFSSSRAGFELRTYRLCRRFLMFHHFPSEAGVGADCLVRALELRYRSGRAVASDEWLGDPRASLLASLTAVGFRRVDGGYLRREMPPVDLEYSLATVDDHVGTIDPASVENLPVGIDGARYHWLDLYGEGLAGVLTEQGSGWFYKRNLSPVAAPDTGGRPTVTLAPATQVATRPNVSMAAGTQLLDLAGDGRPDVVLLDGPLAGFFEVAEGDGKGEAEREQWAEFRHFTSRPTIPLDDPNVRFVDLDGDGRADVLVTEDRILTWFPSLGEAGFGAPEVVPNRLNEASGPVIVFADGTEQIHLADMSGDGLSDIVRVRNGEVCYWPNLGHGRFGAKITMDDAPTFASPGLFHERRVRLADVDGTGCADLMYLGADGARIWFNESGNAWSAPALVPGLPRFDDLSSVEVVDLFGNGTGCLVWSGAHGNDAGRVRYVDLMGGTKPYLLVRSANNLGAETRLTYASSAKFYLQDKVAGTPWITRLSFPVQVVERVETIDRISGNAFTTRYAYHHGHFDGEEREFRGFGMVEQWDTEELAALADPTRPRPTNVDDASHVPPTHAKRWYHTGAFVDRERISSYFSGLVDGDDRGEYWREPAWRDDDLEARRHLLPDSELPVTLLRPDGTRLPRVLTADEEREACRALRGSLLREETFTRDLSTSGGAERPYVMRQQRFVVEMLQARGAGPHAVFLARVAETLEHHYEREEREPRVVHDLVLDADAFGNVLGAASIAYGRRTPDATIVDPNDRAEQLKLHATCAEHRFTALLPEGRAWRTPRSCDSRTYELTGVALAPGQLRFTLAEVRAAVTGAAPLRYEESPSPGFVETRKITHVRTRFRPDDLGSATGDPLALLPLGTMGSRAVEGESYRLALTRGLVTAIHGARVTDAMLTGDGAYVHESGDPDWWVPSGRTFLSPPATSGAAQELAFAERHFFTARRYRDPFHTTARPTETVVDLDAYDLLVEETRDALGNVVTAGERSPAGVHTLRGNDYRVLQPSLMMDANRNRTAVAFDALGMVVGTAVMGKPLPAPVEGDSLAGFEPDLANAVTRAQLDTPLVAGGAVLQRASTRLIHDVFAYVRTKALPEPQPVTTYSLARETHDADPVPAGGARFRHAFSYSDGFGREIQRKAQAEPGPVPVRDAAGRIVVDADGRPRMTATPSPTRWVGTGWKVFDLKGNPVRRFEPFFTDTHRFERDVRVGVSPVLFYDPLGQVVGTLHPDHRWEKVVLGPWRQETWDTSDTVSVADPRTDPDVGDHFRRLAPADFLPTWMARRAGGALGADEQEAARKSADQAGTKVTAFTDSLGRTFATIAHNRTRYSDPPAAPAVDELLRTRVSYDVEGNERAIVDALGRTVQRCAHDMLRTRIRQESMEAGTQWILHDATGRPVFTWDAAGRRLRTVHDQLGRPVRLFLLDGAGGEPCVGRTVYGEGLPGAEAANLRSRIARTDDQSGSLGQTYDFKGNVLRSDQRLAVAYDATIDWSGPVALDPTTFTSVTRWDALNRPVQEIAPHATTAAVSVTQREYGPARSVARIDVWLDQPAEPTALLAPASATLHAVTEVQHDAQGRRTLVGHGNGVQTTFAFDPLTRRLARVLTVRTADVMQDLRYTYDATGHVTHVEDDAQQTLYFRNRRVEPSADYTYDAIHRLIEATGREHLGLAGGAPVPSTYDDAPRVGVSFAVSDGTALGRWLERYVYDAAGNIRSLHHAGTDPAHPGWTRTYDYAEPSQIELLASNRLTRTVVDPTMPEVYSTAGDGYDVHGNMLRMPHLQEMRWDHANRLRMTRRQAVSATDADVLAHAAERTWYVYDAMGQRVRKVTERSPGSVREERVYLGGVEIHRTLGAGGVERETLHVMDGARRLVLVETRTSGDEPGVPRQVVRFQYDNHLGSAALELDERARIISYEEYSPFGTTTFQGVRGQGDAPKRYRFTGKERDSENGLSYHGARYYAPWLGRWVSCDPIGVADGPNLYAYVGSDPVGKVDPAGTQGKKATPPPDDWAQKEIRRLAGEAHSGPQLNIDADGKVTPYYTTIETRISRYEASGGRLSNTDALEAAEGRGHIERGDVKAFGQGLVNGPAGWVNEKPFDVDPRHAGAAMMSGELGKDLLIEAATLGVAKVLDLAKPAGEIAEATSAETRTAEHLAADAPAAAAKAPAVGEAATAAPAATKIDLIKRAAEIEAELGGGEKVTVAVTHANINGVDVVVGTTNNPKAYEALYSGAVKLGEGELLGLPPTTRGGKLRKIWGNPNMHAEELGIETLRKIGAEGGETATSRPGCEKCQNIMSGLNSVFRNEWVHLNPENAVVRPSPGWRKR